MENTSFLSSNIEWTESRAENVLRNARRAIDNTDDDDDRYLCVWMLTEIVRMYGYAFICQ